MNKKLLSGLRYALYPPLHPFKGFYDLKYEGQGSLASALVLLLLYYLSSLLMASGTGYIFRSGSEGPVNVLMVLLQAVMPLLLFTIANWCLTLALDGEGTMAQIGTALCYALVPLTVFQLLYTPLSHVMTLQEGVFLTYGYTLVGAWTAFLVVVAVMETNQYSFLKSIGACLLSIVGIAIILLILLLCFNLVQQMLAFFQSVYKELTYRW